MGLKHPVPSALLRQRFDEDAWRLAHLLDAASVEFMQNVDVHISASSTGHVPLDMDVFRMDNNNSK